MLRFRVVVYNKLRYRTLNIKREFNLEVASFSDSRRQITGDMAVRLITSMAVILISSYLGHNRKIVSSNKCILLDKREGSGQSGKKYEYGDAGVGGGEGHKEQSKSCCFFRIVDFLPEKFISAFRNLLSFARVRWT